VQKWDHAMNLWSRSERAGGVSPEEGLEHLLTRRGEAGWELAAVATEPDGLRLFFKRPV
jgi:hypothetical protein